MFRTMMLGFLMAVAVSLGAHALTGSGDSGTNPLETVLPMLNSVSAVTERSLSATFSEPMLAPGVTTPGSYAASGAGAGTLTAHPTAVSGDGPYALTWTAGEMQNGASVTVTATGVQDLVGNPIDSAHNGASGTGIGVAPVFSNVAANPAQAAVGDTVTITFTASETMDGDPVVTINGHEATWVSGGKAVDFTYRYVVQESDPLGMAGISVTGFDLAGNMGSLSDNAAVEIIEEQAGIFPLHVWPLIVALVFAAAAVLLRKRRFAALLLVAALLASSSALAASPEVSNVTFTQGPNGTTGTKVDIHYDLVAPNGPCAIMLSLSKNAGADGFIYPITHYTGDIANVITGTGHIVWDIRADYPEESIPQARIRVTADDALVQHTLTYSAGANGSISGTSHQIVNHGADGTEVTAVPDLNYHFVKWSDNVMTAARTDMHVTGVITVTASFAANTYTVTFDEQSGTTPVPLSKVVTFDSTYGPLATTTRTGYTFAGWWTAASGGTEVLSTTTVGITANQTLYAHWTANIYTVTFDAQGGTTPSTQPATFDSTYGTLPGTTRTGYTFDGWYTLASGGTEVLSTTTVTTASAQTLYAHWSPIPVPVVTSFLINSGATTSTNPVVTLDNTCTGGPVDYMASESASFTGATWQTYATAPSFTLSGAVGSRTVYFKARNAGGESDVVSDTIFLVPETLSVALGPFDMGQTSAGDDAEYGIYDELPVHAVTLGAYQIGKGEVTNQQYCDVLNWALAQGYLYSDTSGTAWAGSGNIYAGNASGARYLILSFSSTNCNIQYSSGAFSAKTRTGLPGTTIYSMATHPVVMVSWYGSVAFCNWLSQWQGLTPCYNMSTALWPLTVAPPTSGGYRLPTEAEWERAAAWDGSRHWIYGFTSDTLTGSTQCNYWPSSYVNPLGLTTVPYTSPDAWFDGVNESPNGSVKTVTSVSPVGAYDMSGNVWEWCHDWYSEDYYSGGEMTDPTGPTPGSDRVNRGGSWSGSFSNCRSAVRSYGAPSSSFYSVGFRLARS